MIKPFGDKIMVSQMKRETKSSIILTDDSNVVLPKGVVYEIGIGAENKGIKKGDIVFFNDFSGERIESDGCEFLVIKLSEILAVEEYAD